MLYFVIIILFKQSLTDSINNIKIKTSSDELLRNLNNEEINKILQSEEVQGLVKDYINKNHKNLHLLLWQGP